MTLFNYLQIADLYCNTEIDLENIFSKIITTSIVCVDNGYLSTMVKPVLDLRFLYY